MRLVNVAFSRAQCRLIVMLQRGWEQHPALSFLAKQHPPMVLNRDRVDELLLTKLPGPRPTRPASVPISGDGSPKAKPKSIQLSTFEEFVAGLRERVPSGASMMVARQAAQQLRDKARFRKLTFAEVDAAIDMVRKG